MSKVCVLLLVFIMASVAVAGGDFEHGERANAGFVPGSIVGWSFPALGWARHNRQGDLIGFTGPNLGLGWSWKRYIQPFRMDGINTYCSFGTLGFIVPYIMVGIDYCASIGEQAGLGVSFEIGPSPTLLFQEQPYLVFHLGFFLLF